MQHAPSSLDELRQRIQRLEHRSSVAADRPVLPFGIASLDTHLPEGGLPLGVLHEVSGAMGPCHETAATLFIAGILARLQGPVLWCVRGADLFAPGLAMAGLSHERLLFAEAGDEKTLLIIMEEGLRHGGLAAVVGEVKHLSMIASRRLHLAARSSGVTGFALMRQSARKNFTKEPTVSVTRWQIAAMPSDILPADRIGRAFWHIALTRCRDGENADWIMEASNEKGYLGLAADLADGSIATDGKRRTAA